MDKLKPCPFCGGEGKVFVLRAGDKIIAESWVECEYCGARVSPEVEIDMVIDAWNRRVVE